MDLQSLQCVSDNLNQDNPLGSHEFYVLIETSGSNQVNDREALENFLQTAVEQKIITDAVVADDGIKVKVIQ